ncbi:MAG: hypothetical protein J0L75_17610 [Spirochaetes bacterium]|nr:hypothetical protein [Spirochaetota bacterium]
MRLELLRQLAVHVARWFHHMEKEQMLLDPPVRTADPYRRSNQTLALSVQIRQYLSAHFHRVFRKDYGKSSRVFRNRSRTEIGTSSMEETANLPPASPNQKG